MKSSRGEAKKTNEGVPSQRPKTREQKKRTKKMAKQKATSRFKIASNIEIFGIKKD